MKTFHHRKIYFYFLIAALIFTSCKKNNASAEGNQKSNSTKIYLLSQYKYNDQTVNYQYDSKNRIVEITTTPSYGGPSDQKLTYDNNDRLIEEDLSYTDSNVNGKNIYQYGTGIITLSATFDGYTSVGILTLNSQNQVLKATFDNSAYTFIFDANGNVSSYQYFAAPNATGPSSTYNYTFGTHKSPLLNARGNFEIGSLPLKPEVFNNVITVTHIIPPFPGLTSTSTYTYNYTYNSDDYPTSRTSVQGNIPVTETYTYIQQ